MAIGPHMEGTHRKKEEERTQGRRQQERWHSGMAPSPARGYAAAAARQKVATTEEVHGGSSEPAMLRREGREHGVERRKTSSMVTKMRTKEQHRRWNGRRETWRPVEEELGIRRG